MLKQVELRKSNKSRHGHATNVKKGNPGQPVGFFDSDIVVDGDFQKPRLGESEGCADRNQDESKNEKLFVRANKLPKTFSKFDIIGFAENLFFF